jgi:hypothetical protein
VSGGKQTKTDGSYKLDNIHLIHIYVWVSKNVSSTLTPLANQLNLYVMNKLQKRVAEINALINKAIADDVMAIECDSTWESGYSFRKVALLKTQIRVYYHEYNGIRPEDKMDSYSFDDAFYILNWVKRCINKGYREQVIEEN